MTDPRQRIDSFFEREKHANEQFDKEARRTQIRTAVYNLIALPILAVVLALCVRLFRWVAGV